MIFIRFLKVLFTFFIASACSAQIPNIILGRPTDKSVTASIMAIFNGNASIEFGSTPTSLSGSTSPFTLIANTPLEFDISSLMANSRYYYRLKYKKSGATDYEYSPVYSFQTQRSKGQPFVFTIEADEHLYDKKGVFNMYRVTLQNQAKDKPDFMFSLGDIFGDDHQPYTITSAEVQDLRLKYRPFLGEICHSVPFYVALGNHEGECDKYLNTTPPNNLCVWSTQWRKHYYPNPYPNSFYSGNQDNESYGIGNPENYYAWTWGDALFVVLDVYRDQNDTSDKPKGWDWSLGLAQYNWLKSTLEGSDAKYKFVFAHHIRGQGRGGVTNAKLFEWGGFEQDGRTNTFAAKRPLMAKPIHQLFVDNGVNIFFQGHDHVFAHEVMDGVVYQAVPMAADSTYEIGMLANADAYVSDTVAGTGHLRVSVEPECVKVDFVRAYLPADTSATRKNGEIAFTYTLGTCTDPPPPPPSPEEGDEMIIYPNPSDAIVNIKFKQPLNNLKVSMFNASGQLIQAGNTTAIDCSRFASGTYLIRAFNNGKEYSGKLVIQHP